MAKHATDSEWCSRFLRNPRRARDCQLYAATSISQTNTLNRLKFVKIVFPVTAKFMFDVSCPTCSYLYRVGTIHICINKSRSKERLNDFSFISAIWTLVFFFYLQNIKISWQLIYKTDTVISILWTFRLSDWKKSIGKHLALIKVFRRKYVYKNLSESEKNPRLPFYALARLIRQASHRGWH